MFAPTDNTLTFIGFGPTGDLGPLTGYTSKRGKAVWYLKAPPKTPATGWQQRQRNQFKITALLWNGLTEAARQDWLTAARRAHLNITGYNLFVWYQYTQDHAVIHTIEQQAKISLIPLC